MVTSHSDVPRRGDARYRARRRCTVAVYALLEFVDVEEVLVLLVVALLVVVTHVLTQVAVARGEHTAQACDAG